MSSQKNNKNNDDITIDDKNETATLNNGNCDHAHDHDHAHSHAGHAHSSGHEHHEHGDHEHPHKHDHEHHHSHPHKHHGHAHKHSTGEHDNGHHHHDHAPSHNHHDHGHHYHEHHRQTQGTVLTVRAASGLSGDIMLAGMLRLAKATDEMCAEFLKELHVPALENVLTLEPRSVNAIGGWSCRITLPQEHAHRTCDDIEAIIEASHMPEQAKTLAAKTFHLLAQAEAAVHDGTPENVTFHEVGALDSILDICLVCRLFVLLAPKRFVCSPLPLADGVIHCAHGKIISPAPAVAMLLHDVPVVPFSGSGETVTPTALALLKALSAEFGPWPAMTVSDTVITYGTKVFANAPNGALWAIGQGAV